MKKKSVTPSVSRFGAYPCSGLVAAFSLGRVELHGATWDDGRDRMLVHHLRDGVLEQYHVLVERLDLPLELDTVHEVDRDRHILAAERVQERVLEDLAFVAHSGNSFMKNAWRDAFAVGKLQHIENKVNGTTLISRLLYRYASNGIFRTDREGICW